MRTSRTALVTSAAFAAFAACSLMIASAPAQDDYVLPDGPELFSLEAQCGYCHDAAPSINRSMGQTREGWEEFVSHMAPSDPHTQDQILDYLAHHFGPTYNPRPATLVDGELEVSFQNWIGTTPGQGLRGVAQAPDQSIWFVGTRNNNIGRVEPETGRIREWSLPANTMPENVAIDAQGGVWFIGAGNSTIGRFDAETGNATVTEMSDAEARGPNTAVFDANGVMWFTVERGNMIGRFDPSSGQTRFAPITAENTRPFDIAIAPDGTVWASCSASNCLIRVNPQTMETTQVALPEGATARRISVASDGAVWYTNFSQGRIGRVDPQSGETREWDSPSGANAQPYAIAIVDGIVWYNESGVRPDPLVRFDPNTETFQSWPIQSGNIQAGMARQMRVTSDGNLLLNQDATNRVILVTLPPAG